MFNKTKPSAYEREMRGLSQFFKDELSKDYTDTASGASKIGMLRDQDQQIRQGIDKTSAIAGSTDESKIAQKAGANKAYTSGLRSVMAGADADRARTENNYLTTARMAENERQRREQNRSDAIGSLVGNLSNVAGNFLAYNAMAPQQGQGNGVIGANLGATGNVAGITGQLAPQQANFSMPSLTATMTGANTNNKPNPMSTYNPSTNGGFNPNPPTRNMFFGGN